MIRQVQPVPRPVRIAREDDQTGEPTRTRLNAAALTTLAVFFDWYW
jgi:hypothetical protein